MRRVAIQRPKPKFHRNDPAQVELVRKLQGYSYEQLKHLEAAIREYVDVGNVGPELAALIKAPEARVALAA